MSVDSDVFCRLCLEKCKLFYFSLFEHDAPKMLESLTQIKISSDDDFSTWVCSQCLIQLRNAYETQQTFLKNESKLRNRLLKENETKHKNNILKPIKKENLVDVQNSQIDSNVKSDDLEQEIETTLKVEEVIIKEEDHDYCANKFAMKFTCNTCSQVFYSSNVYLKHLDCHIKVRYCPVCVKHIPLEEFDQHMLQHSFINTESDDLNVQFACEVCSKVSNSTEGFLKHLEEHAMTNCGICRRDVPTKEIKEHRKQHQSGFCDYCAITLKNENSLRAHITRCHTDQKAECEVCGFNFSSMSSLQSHQRRVHTGESSHVCDVCGKKFYGITPLNKHMKMHSNQEELTCDVCKKVCINPYRLKRHKLKHGNENPFICEICGKGFNFKANLRVHQKTKHNKTELATHKCKMCDKGFASNWALKAHAFMHYK